ncbi:hypothetical protein PFICI_14021 [Pestalotiopsis fici W106-1]|uniref:Uncharacterized protein n=1 Tax=Pestalotiopsis fici (strain W106-1 / CGMCC3.15140) TaxID=1229662 RepID=W3WJQ3_PESFW|nr:uncharacterized protein PFICI_14021 [Pestalotiopsis fici W106-1]ETS74155.1 hypothetical protein PFICI_14021 [Pestalotiopsis fici W106-1]
MPLNLEDIRSGDIRSVRVQPGINSFTEKEHGYLDGGILGKTSPLRVILDTNRLNLDLRKAKAYNGGLQVTERRSYSGVKAAIPSQLAWLLNNRILQHQQNFPKQSLSAQIRDAMREVLAIYCGDGVLFDFTTDDEEYLRRVLATNASDTSLIFRKNPRAFPKVFKNWEPKDTEFTNSLNGFKIVLVDTQKRPLIQVVVGDYEEHQGPNNKVKKITWYKPSASNLPPASPLKRKTGDVQQKDCTNDATTSQDPFKKPKVVDRLSVEVKRSPAIESARIETLDTKVYGTSIPFPRDTDTVLILLCANVEEIDARKIRGMPGGFEIGPNQSGFASYFTGLSGIRVAVPSELAKFLRNKAIDAANNAQRGGSPRERVTAAVQEFMSEEFSGQCVLMNLTTEEEAKFLRAYDGDDYRSVAFAVRARPASVDSMSVFQIWDPTATTVERAMNGQVTVIFKDYYGETLMGAWVDE